MSRMQWKTVAGGAAVATALASATQAAEPLKGTLVATVGKKTYEVSVLCDMFGDRYIQFRSDDTDINEPVDLDGDGVVITGSPALAKGKLSVIVFDETGIPISARAIPFEKSGDTVTAAGKVDPPSKKEMKLKLTCN